jgi:hypothetical protein
MKKQENILTKVENQNRKSIKDALSGMNRKLTGIEKKTGSNIGFLIQNKAKGPPGRSRSPGTEC